MISNSENKTVLLLYSEEDRHWNTQESVKVEKLEIPRHQPEDC